MTDMNYRERCYGSYIKTHWSYAHSQLKDEVELYARAAAVRYPDFLPADKSASIIDVACGSGHFLYFLRKQGYINSLGIDISREQLDVAAEMGMTNIQQADLFEYLPRHSESFDMIAANDIIEHLHKDEAIHFLDISYRALRPGGNIFIGAPNVQCLLGGKARYCDFTHEQGFTPGSLAQVMRVCGFSGVQVRGESPAVHDYRSAVRAGLWQMVKCVLKLYLLVESGTGRGMWKADAILEPRMFAVGKKVG